MKWIKWSKHDDNIIKQYYASKTPGEIQEMLEDEHSINAIYHRGSKFNLKRSERSDSWSEDDRDILRNNWNDKTVSEVKEMLDGEHSEVSIYSQVSLMGLSEGTWSEHDTEVVKEYYVDTPTNEIQDKLDSERTKTAIGVQAAKLGIRKRSMTGIEVKLREKLEDMNLEYVEQKSVGPWTVDFYLPDYHLAVEADGDYWHDKPGVKAKDKRKNQWFSDKLDNIFRLSGTEIKKGNYGVQLRKAINNSVIKLY